MIRKFCDLCDTEMDDDSRVFTVGVMESSDSAVYNRGKDVRLAAGDYIVLTQHHGMVCLDCVVDIAKVIREKKARNE